MKLFKLFAGALVALTLSVSANAALLVGTQGWGGSATDYSEAGLASFNLDVTGESGLRLQYVLQEADLAGPLRLSAMILNMSGMPFKQFRIGVAGISFIDALGSVTPTFGSLGSVNAGAQQVGIGFAGAEPAEFTFGNPLGVAGLTDWLLDTRGLQAGHVFTITAFVPEPSTTVLMLPLLLAGFMVARRRR